VAESTLVVASIMATPFRTLLAASFFISRLFEKRPNYALDSLRTSSGFKKGGCDGEVSR
jgi:hypothetical protein